MAMAEEERDIEHSEWGILRIAGRPLMSSFTAHSGLLWIACRASRRLVHVYCDSRLQIIWHFPFDPIFICLERGTGVFLKKAYKTSYSESSPVLLVITQDGSIWLLPVSPTAEAMERPFKRRKGRLDQEAYNCENDEWGLFDDIDLYAKADRKYDSDDKTTSSSRSMVDGSAHDHIGNASSSNSPGISLFMKPVALSFAQKFVHKNSSILAMQECVVGVIKDACFACLGPQDKVIVSSGFGLQCFHLPSWEESFVKLESTDNIEFFPSKTTCGLVVRSASNISSNSQGHVMLHEKLYDAFSDALTGEKPEFMLIKGDLAGHVYVCPFYGQNMNSSASMVVCKLGEPILCLFAILSGNDDCALSFSIERTKGMETPSYLDFRDTLLIVGQYGHVIAITCKHSVECNSCIISSSCMKYKESLMVNLNCSNLYIHDWRIEGQITSACMTGFQYLCYCTGSEAFVSLLFEDDNANSDMAKSDISNQISKDQTSLIQSQAMKHNLTINTSKHVRYILRDTLQPRRILVADSIILIAGKECPISNSVGRSMAVLTAQGRIIGVNILHCALTGSLCRMSWRTSELNLEEHIKCLIDKVDKVSSACDYIQQYNNSVNSAIRELAVSLKVAALMLCSTKKDSFENLIPSSNSGYTQPSLRCAIKVNPFPVRLVSSSTLGFGNNTGNSNLDYMTEVLQNDAGVIANITVTLHNCTSFLLSSHWTLVLELQKGGLLKDKIVSYSSIINNGAGLSPNAECNMEFDVKLPSLHAGPVYAFIYLCHVHDEHERIHEHISADQWKKVSTLKSFPCSTPIQKNDMIRVGHNFTEHAFGSTMILLSHHKIDILSIASKQPERLHQTVKAICPVARSFTLVMNEGKEKAVYERILGTYFGTLTVSNVEGMNCLGSGMNVQCLWRTIFRDQFWEEVSTSKASDKITFMVSGQNLFSISVKKVNDQETRLNIEAPTFHLGCFIKEALTHRLKYHEKNINLQNRTEKSKNVDNDDNLFESIKEIIDRALVLLAIWTEKKLQNMVKSQEVLPVLQDIHAVVIDILTLYRGHWEKGKFSYNTAG